jgi:hypothetical protein
MTSALTLTDLLVLGGAIATGLGAVQILIAIGDRFWGKPSPKVAAEQSAKCGLQHETLRGEVAQLTRTMSEQTAALNRMATGISEQAHADQLRHQALFAKLDLMTQQHQALHTDIRDIKRRVEA